MYGIVVEKNSAVFNAEDSGQGGAMALILIDE